MVAAVQISSLCALSLPRREHLRCCRRQTDKPEWAASPRWTETTDGSVPTPSFCIDLFVPGQQPSPQHCLQL